MKERLERRKEGRGERDVGKDQGGRVDERGGRGGWRGWEGGSEGGRQARMEDALPGTHLSGSVGVSRLLLFLPCRFLAAGGVIAEGLERWRRGRGQRLLQPPLAEVRCLLLRPPARVSASLGAGSEAAPPLPPPAPRPAQARAAAARIAARGSSMCAGAAARSLARLRGPRSSVGLREAPGGMARARTAWGAPSGRGGGGAGEARPAPRRRWGEGTVEKGHRRRAQVPCP